MLLLFDVAAAAAKLATFRDWRSVDEVATVTAVLPLQLATGEADLVQLGLPHAMRSDWHWQRALKTLNCCADADGNANAN